MTYQIRPAKPRDVRAIAALVRPYANRRILLSKDLIDFFEDVQEFFVAEEDGKIVACGALHVLWEDLAEVRTVAVDPSMQGRGVGKAILHALHERANQLGIRRIFCLTFEREFFESQGYKEIDETPVSPEVFQQMLRSFDDGVAEFLDLARAKPNTLGNYRMLKEIQLAAQ